MKLQDLIERSGLPARTLRYVFDHGIVPNLEVGWAVHDAGRPRVFADDVGFAVACAAILLEAGVKRKAVHQFLGMIAVATTKSRNGRPFLILPSILQGAMPVTAQLGEGGYLRFQFDDVRLPFDADEHELNAWIAPTKLGAKVPENYDPRVVIQLDLGCIRDRLRKDTNPRPAA